MLLLAIILFFVDIVLAIFAFGGIPGVAVGLATILFWTVLVLFLICLFFGIREIWPGLGDGI